MASWIGCMRWRSSAFMALGGSTGLSAVMSLLVRRTLKRAGDNACGETPSDETRCSVRGERAVALAAPRDARP
jgi:hypothetical protein